MVSTTSSHIPKALMALCAGCIALFLACYIPAGDTFFGTLRASSQQTLTTITALETNAYYAINLPVFLQKMPALNLIALLGSIIGVLFFLLHRTQSFAQILVSTLFLLFTLVSFDGITLFSLLAAIAILLNLYALSAPHRFALLFLSAGLLPLQFPVSILTACLLYALLHDKETTARTLSRSFIVFLIAMVCFALLRTEVPQLLGLPLFSRFVPSSGSGLGVEPLLGPAPERPFLNDRWIAHRITFFMSLAVILAWITSFQSRLRQQAIAFCIFALLLFWESDLLPASIRATSPLAGLSRLIPYAKWYSVLQIATIGFVIYTARILTDGHRRIQALSFMFPIALMVYAPIDSFFHTVVSSQKRPIDTLINSPSLYILKSGLPLPPQPLPERYTLTKSDILNSWASTNESKLSAIFDRSTNTRWSTVPQTQKGGEWIALALSAPRAVSGIAVPVPHYIGDFPRGINVFNGSPTQTGCTKETLLYQEPWWRGAIERLPSGHVGFMQDYKVELYFKEPALLSCLTIEQTGSDPSYEWSIESIDLLAPLDVQH
jgi:hypothetical protein